MSGWNLRGVARRILPPAVVDLYRLARQGGIRFRGRYRNWEEARRHSTGYDAMEVLDRVRTSALHVREGDARYERDSVLLQTIPYPFPLLTVLLRAALACGGSLSVLDLGGALGSSYYQCRDFLAEVTDLRWCVVEQPNFVACGKRLFETEELRFYLTIEECLRHESPQVALLSGVLQYLPDPHAVLREVTSHKLAYLVIDRTPFSISCEEILSVQMVPPVLGGVSYPVWLFDEKALLQSVRDDYTMLAEFDAVDGILGTGKMRAQFKGMIFARSDHA